MVENFEDQLNRLRQMTADNSKWDLSDNDIAAIKAALAFIDKTNLAEPEAVLPLLGDAATKELGEDAEMVLCPGCKKEFDSVEAGWWGADSKGHPTIENIACPHCGASTIEPPTWEVFRFDEFVWQRSEKRG